MEMNVRQHQKGKNVKIEVLLNSLNEQGWGAIGPLKKITYNGYVFAF